jgi:hypothetical protein
MTDLIGKRDLCRRLEEISEFVIQGATGFRTSRKGKRGKTEYQ